MLSLLALLHILLRIHTSVVHIPSALYRWRGRQLLPEPFVLLYPLCPYATQSLSVQ